MLHTGQSAPHKMDQNNIFVEVITISWGFWLWYMGVEFTSGGDCTKNGLLYLGSQKVQSPPGPPPHGPS